MKSATGLGRTDAPPYTPALAKARRGAAQPRSRARATLTRPPPRKRNHARRLPCALHTRTPPHNPHPSNPPPQTHQVLTHESGPAVDWLCDSFKLDLSLVSQLGGHSYPRTHRGNAKFPGFTITCARACFVPAESRPRRGQAGAANGPARRLANPRRAGPAGTRCWRRWRRWRRRPKAPPRASSPRRT